MKKFVLMAMVAALVVPAIAAPTYKVNIMAPGGTVPYVVSSTDATFLAEVVHSNGSFQTFCLEPYNGFYQGNYTATIDYTVQYPTNAPVTTPSTGGVEMILTSNAQKIYAAFLAGQLTGFQALVIQDTIWAVQHAGQDDSSQWTWNYTSDADVLAAASDFADSNNSWTRVRVLNLWGEKGTDYQSQLVMVVPAPGAILLTGIGTTLVGWLRRRRSL